MPSGWTRLIFENFEFPYELVFPPDLDAGNLNAKFDVLVFNDSPLAAVVAADAAAAVAPVKARHAAAGRGARRSCRRRGGGRGGRRRRADRPRADGPDSRRSRFRRSSRSRQGNVTAATLEKIREFIEAGGTVIGIGSSADGSSRRSSCRSRITSSKTAVRSAARSITCRVRCCASPSIPPTRSRTATARKWTSSSTTVRSGDRLRARAAPTSAPSPGSPAPRRCAAAGPGARSISTRASRWRKRQWARDASCSSAMSCCIRSQPHGTYRFFFNGLYLSVVEASFRGQGGN